MEKLRQIAERLDNEKKGETHYITRRLFADGSGEIKAFEDVESKTRGAGTDRELWTCEFESLKQLDAFFAGRTRSLVLIQQRNNNLFFVFGGLPGVRFFTSCKSFSLTT